MTRPAASVLFCAVLAAGARPAAAESFARGEFHEVTTQQEIADFYQQNPEVQKIKEKYDQDMKRRREQGLAPPDGRPVDAPLDDETQADDARSAAADPDTYMRDLKAEYLEEKGQLAEETIWAAAEEKAAPEVRQLYRTYLRQLYFHGHGFDGDSAQHVALIRGMIDARGGYHGLPTADMGENPPGAAGTYGGWHVRMTTGVLDICVFSHEMFHWTDDYFGGVDGQSMRDQGPEPYAYAHMCREL